VLRSELRLTGWIRECVAAGQNGDTEVQRVEDEQLADALEPESWLRLAVKLWSRYSGMSAGSNLCQKGISSSAGWSSADESVRRGKTTTR
jgi:hypothetical protein